MSGLLPKLGAPSADRLRELRAVEVLEIAGTPEAAAVLGEWAKDTTLRIRPDAAAGLRRLAKR